MSPRLTASTPVEQWPLFLSAREVAIVRGCSYKALLNALGKGTAWPPPVMDEHGYLKPYRFARTQVADALRGALPRPRRVVHPRRRLTPAQFRRTA